MALARLDIGVVMQRRPPAHPWDDGGWAAVAVVPWDSGTEDADLVRLDDRDGRETWLARGLQLALCRDENDGYFENWAAPAPKVFVMWQMRESRPVPVVASVSYTEGARMLDSGDCAEGLPMPRMIHEWLAQYLAAHHRPKARLGRAHG